MFHGRKVYVAIFQTSEEKSSESHFGYKYCTQTTNQLCQSSGTSCEKALEGLAVRFCKNRMEPRCLCENINFKEIHFSPFVRRVERVICSNGIGGAASLRRWRLLVAQFAPHYCVATCSVTSTIISLFVPHAHTTH